MWVCNFVCVAVLRLGSVHVIKGVLELAKLMCAKQASTNLIFKVNHLHTQMILRNHTFFLLLCCVVVSNPITCKSPTYSWRDTNKLVGMLSFLLFVPMIYTSLKRLHWCMVHLPLSLHLIAHYSQIVNTLLVGTLYSAHKLTVGLSLIEDFFVWSHNMDWLLLLEVPDS